MDAQAVSLVLAAAILVVVVPVLVASGRVSTEKLPKDLEGLPIVYTTEGLLPHAEMARWVESRVRTAVATAAIGRAD